MRELQILLVISLILLISAVSADSYITISENNMTGYSSNGFTATASTTSGASYAYTAFDGVNTGNGWQSASGVLPSPPYSGAWVQQQLPSPRTATTYQIYPFSSAGYYPANWTFSGSNDNTTFTTLDTHTPYILVAFNSGVAIGGVAREATHGQPIGGAAITAQNLSTGSTQSTTTNIAGYYLCDVGSACYLTHNNLYLVHGSKLGYQNSTNYRVLA